MSSNDVLTRDDDIDVASLITALRRNLWLIILVTLVAGAALFFILLSISPRYLSTAEVLIATKTSTAVEQIQEGNNRQVDNRLDERAVRTEVEILSSDKIALEVIEELGLVRIDEFREDSGVTDNLADYLAEATVGRPARDPDATVVEDITTQDVAKSTALRIFSEKLEVYVVEGSQVIRIEFWSENPALARNVVAAITKRYQTSKVDATKENNAIAAGFVNPRINELRELIADEKRAIAQFESDNQIFKTNNGGVDGPGLLVNQELSESSTELSRLRAERSAAQAKIASIRAALKSGSSLDVIPEVLNSAYIQSLRQSEVAIQAQISDLSTSLLPQHPQLKALNSQLERYRSQIRKATQDIISSLENNVASTRNTEKKLSEEIDRLKNDQLKVNALMVKRDGFEKNIAAYEEELRQRLVDSQQVRSRADIPPEGANVISAASIPDESYFPKVVPFTLAGMTAAAVLSALGVLATSLVTTVSNSHVKNKELEPKIEPNPESRQMAEVENTGQTNNAKTGNRGHLNELEGIILGNMRTKSGGDNQSNSSANENTIAVRYAASVLSDMGKGRIVVVSPGGDAGSKTTSILARLLTNSRRKVVVIDLSGGLATTQEMLGATEVPGIFNLVNGSITAEDAIFTDSTSSAHIISAGTLFEGTPMPDMHMVGEAIDAIAASYDFCVVDCGDANLEGVDLVSTDDAVIVISAINADVSDCNLLERDLKADGFKDILQIVPDQKDAEKESLIRA